MDLAKIRHKARQEQEKRHLEASLPLKTKLPEPTVPHEAVTTQQIFDDEDFFQSVKPEYTHNAFPEILQALLPAQRIVQRDPLAEILAGREAAGCAENLPLVSEAHADSEQVSYQEFLCFKVSDEVYGIDIMDIKELIKPREVTEVPRTPSFVSGIISLRGVIIPIIDMLDRLGLARETVTGRERVIVVRQGESFSGLMVDEIIKVVRIVKDDIEAAPPVLEGIDRDFVSGIGRADGRMIILLNLSNITDIHLY
jgi:purine-binding chemotaxis protein CheW